MKAEKLTTTVKLPEGVTASIAGKALSFKGTKGEVTRDFNDPRVELSVAEGTVKVVSNKATRREKTLLGTFDAHIRNMINGVQRGHAYRLKICSGHFPMNVSVSGSQFIVKNFLGEKTPRTLVLRPGVQVKVEGSEVHVSGIDKELTGQTAANIELLTRVKGRDRRVFQDGIYIIDKDGKLIE